MIEIIKEELLTRLSAPKTARVRDNGFAMIELMVALVILSIALAPLTTTFFRSWFSTMGSRRLSVARTLAHQKLESVRAEVPYGDLSSEQGGFPSPHHEFRWELVVRELGEEQPEYSVKILELSVIFPSGSGENRTVRCSNRDDCGVPDLVMSVRKPVRRP